MVALGVTYNQALYMMTILLAAVICHRGEAVERGA
jgi:hypothetical protein